MTNSLAPPRVRPGATPQPCRALLPALWLAALIPAAALAGDRLLAAGGITNVEGSAGGGLVPWALVAGLGTEDQVGGTASCTTVRPAHFRLDACATALGIANRVELSIARQVFDLGQTAPGQAIRQDIYGLKLRLAGDALFAPNAWLPQIALGVQARHNLDFEAVPRALGARRARSADYYLAATRAWLDGPFDRTWLVDLTLRSTEANQFGLLGFGGDQGGRRLEPEGSVGVFVRDHWLLGSEYRAKPDNLRAFRERRAWDAFVAWLPFKPLAITAAYADLGPIADHGHERGPYLSIQGSW